MNVAILAHERFPDRAKTAVGVLRYADYDVQAVLDRETAGSRVADHLDGVQDAPIVADIDAVEGPLDALIVGIAPIGGGFDERWRPDVRGALERGCDVISGLHYFLEDDPDFRRLAEANNCRLWDVRKPDEDLTVSRGIAGEVDVFSAADLTSVSCTAQDDGSFSFPAETRTELGSGFSGSVTSAGRQGLSVHTQGDAALFLTTTRSEEYALPFPLGTNGR
jgi:uncharacterized NAD-dependent epimerase/dehydratase family protein